MRVLIIEDNPDLTLLYCELLRGLGCETLTAANGRTGIEAATRWQPDLVFCDLRLPGDCDGLEVARVLRQQHALHDVVMMAISGYAGPDGGTSALDAGFDRMYNNPVKYTDIMDMLGIARRKKASRV